MRPLCAMSAMPWVSSTRQALNSIVDLLFQELQIVCWSTEICQDVGLPTLCHRSLTFASLSLPSLLAASVAEGVFWGLMVLESPNPKPEVSLRPDFSSFNRSKSLFKTLTLLATISNCLGWAKTSTCCSNLESELTREVEARFCGYSILSEHMSMITQYVLLTSSSKAWPAFDPTSFSIFAIRSSMSDSLLSFCILAVSGV